jgi:hypothetical protein
MKKSFPLRRSMKMPVQDYDMKCPFFLSIFLVHIGGGGVDGIDQYFSNANPGHPTSDVNDL